MLTLYHHAFSQHARRVTALLDEAAIPYSIQHVALNEGAHLRAAYLTVNANRQVPTLVDGTLTIHESNAILRYVCNKYALVDWYPTDPETRAIVDQWLDWNQCRLAPPVTDIVYNRVFMGAGADAAVIASGESQLAELAEILAGTLSSSPYLAGNGPTIADLSVGSNLTQLLLAEMAMDHPVVEAWYQRLSLIPGFARSLPS